MYPLKCVCKNEKKNGLQNIYIQYCQTSQKRTLLTTGIEIPPKMWDDRRARIREMLPEQFGQALELNKSIRDMITIVKDLIDLAIQNDFDQLTFVKSVFAPKMLNGYNRKQLADTFRKELQQNVVSAIDFFGQLDNF